MVLLERGGAIVSVSSGNARRPSPMNADYGAAKAGLSNLAEALSDEFAPRGIRVDTVSPGPVMTPWWTDVVALLASPRSASTAGADFAVDCGFVKAV
jgi:NAD(P)-dependent dehydrogenase (short-subunit alcohol dehydrogenase family)